MGQILSQPITEKKSETGGDKDLAYGLSCMQGWRISMEDSHSTILNLNDDNASKAKISFFGVYDGHGGDKVALFTGDNLHTIIKKTRSFQAVDYPQSLKDGFLACDKAILEDIDMKNDDSGCAATSILITKDKIICGNAGDSRTVLATNGQAKPLSYDHKPSNDGEKARIVNAGGFVDIGRVNGNLALSRGIGDFEFKKNVNLPPEEQVVTAYPDVIEHLRNDNDEFVILACDGIWDCLTSQQAVEIARRGIKDRKTLVEICEIMMDICLAPTSGGTGIGCDNMSVVIVALLNGRTETEWYDNIISRIDSGETVISPPYEEIYKNLYGAQYKFGENSDESEPEDVVAAAKNPSLTLQKLLESNAITNQNGVLYLDTSSASSLLAHFGMSNGDINVDDDNSDDVNDEEEDKLQELDETEPTV